MHAGPRKKRPSHHLQTGLRMGEAETPDIDFHKRQTKTRLALLASEFVSCHL